MKQANNTILVVDDEPALREIFSGWLRSLDCGEVLTASNGVEALALLESRPIALLVTDVRMPGMDGVTLVKRLPEGARIPSIVFVSAFSDVNEREMYGLGAGAFLAKPLRKEDLTNAVKQALASCKNLWKEQPLLLPRHTVEIGDPGGGAAVFALGRGGFCARYAGPVALGRVGFVCHHGDGQTVLKGTGIVRWRSRQENLIGVEFTYLDELSRAYVVSALGSQPPRSYIPENIQETEASAAG